MIACSPDPQRLIYRQPGDLEREPGLEAHVTSEIDGVGGTLDDVAEHRVADVKAFDAGALDGRFRRDHGQVHGRHGAPCAPEVPNGVRTAERMTMSVPVPCVPMEMTE